MSKTIEYALKGRYSGAFLTVAPDDHDYTTLAGRASKYSSINDAADARAQRSVSLSRVVNWDIVRITTETAEPTTTRRVIHIDAEIPEGAEVVGFGLCEKGLRWTLKSVVNRTWTQDATEALVFAVQSEAFTAAQDYTTRFPDNCLWGWELVRIIEETTPAPEPVVTIEEVA